MDLYVIDTHSANVDIDDKIISGLLPHLVNLQKLDLTLTSITDEPVKFIAQNCRSLTSLALGKTFASGFITKGWCDISGKYFHTLGTGCPLTSLNLLG